MNRVAKIAVSLLMLCPWKLWAVTASYGTNLVANSGAEDSTGSSSGINNVVPFWENGATSGATTSRNLDTAANVQRYHPEYTVGAPKKATGLTNNGSNFLFGSNVEWGNDSVLPGARPNSIALQQTVNVSTMVGIGEGTNTFNANAWFGGYSNNNDSAYWDITFLNSSGVPVGSAIRLGGITAAERGNDSRAWLNRSTSGTIPAGTQSIRFDIWFTDPNLGPDVGSDAGIDNLTFVATRVASIPECSALALLLVAVMPVLGRHRRNL